MRVIPVFFTTKKKEKKNIHTGIEKVKKTRKVFKKLSHPELNDNKVE